MDNIQLNTELQQIITSEQAWYFGIIPKACNSREISFYIDDKNKNETIKEELEILFGKSIILENYDSQIIKKTLARYYRQNQKTHVKVISAQDLHKTEDTLFKLIYEANSINSSDIHIEVFENNARVRYRIDGKLMEKYVLDRNDYPSLINKIKIKANLDIAEKRLPQDGRIFFKSDGDSFDIRVSVLPTLYGEKVVLRLLNRDATNIDIHFLGFSEEQLSIYLEGLKKTKGIILISGPTGSGKTTTLYATLKILNQPNINILTIEDPIEYTLEGINQVQLRENIGLNFASALRTFLRQDPDIIMLGEIRDSETAEMAIRAALTGHLVLSTIHTNSAWDTVSRLTDMNIPAFLIANTLNLSIAQRLVRVLCPLCKTKKTFETNLLPKSYKSPYSIDYHYESRGCEACHFTGFKGRRAIYEIIPINSEVSDIIKKGDLNRNESIFESVKSLADQAFNMIAQGITSIDEVYPILLDQK